MATDFSRALALLRKEKGISQRVAAEGIGISQALLSHYETGAREPGLSFVSRACSYYNVTADFLLGRTMVRDGAPISPDTLHDAGADKQNRMGDVAVSAVLGKKMVMNAVSLLFDVAGRSRHTGLIAELTNFFAAIVYRVFRHFYAVSGTNEKGFFPIPHEAYGAAANSEMAACEARMLAILHNKADAPELPALSNERLNAEYPQMVQSLYTLVHQAGERSAKKLP